MSNQKPAVPAICLGAAILLTQSSVAFSQPATSRDVSDPAIESVIVTGTRRSQRTIFESTAPIDVVSSSEINSAMSEDLSDVMAQLVPSYKVQRLPMADGQVFVRPATLRALSPDHTLVLVNGKRRHRSALLGGNGAQSPDLAQIPTFAIGRVEVLRDGASAQYGSDAIAGVINIILDNSTEFRSFVQYSEYSEGDGENTRFGLKSGLPLGTAGFLTATMEYADAEKTSRSRQRPDAIQFQAENPNVVVPNPVQNWGQPETESLRFMFNSAYSLSSDLELYGFGSIGSGEGLSDFNWRNPDSTSAFNITDVFPGFDLRTLYPAGFSPQFGQEDEDRSLTVGIRGDINPDLSWDLSAGLGSNRIDYNMANSINASLGPQSPTTFDIGALKQSELNLNLDFNYVIAIGNLAFGLERRKETYEVQTGDVASYAIGPGANAGLPSGSNGFPGFSPEQAGESSQSSLSGYVDLEMPLNDALTVGVAGRYEDYSEHDDRIFTGKLTGRYAINDNLAMRATLSNGFRAPTPGQLFSERTSQGLDTVTLNIFTNGRFSPTGDVARIVSNRAGVDIKPLDAEESTNISAGIVFRNDAGFNSSLDVYRIEVDNRFGTSAGYTLTDAERAELSALGVPGGEGITRVNFFQNDFDTRSSGVDLVVGYAMEAGAGQLALSSSFNYNQTEVVGGSFENNETNRIRFEENLPQQTLNLSANYLVGNFDFMGRVRYYGSWTDFSFNADGDIHQKFGAESFTDVSATWQATQQLSVRLGAENVFDQYPDEAEFQANRGLIYSRNAPYDTDGRSVYLRLDLSL
ncbi:TonB-dependent receptor [Pseudohongiella acticola]|jgi:iron complex outermembrane recepter protein|uniref:TonB-dependent receptor plug domain-containing protein n=1 Tax=Pseudohongiella acticola TaxID=1524254 RepID=UPI0030ED8654